MTHTEHITCASGRRVEIWQGDCLESLRAMPDESVHCCVTSPPYWGLRDYGTGTWEGGDPECDHQGAPKASDKSGLKDDGRPAEQVGRNAYEEGAFTPFKSTCPKCGAIRVDKQIGLEDTPEQFIEKLVTVFREVRRVLRSDGTCWVNMGDGYAGSWGAQSRENAGKHAPNISAISANQARAGQGGNRRGSIERTPSCKPKDLIGQPWMLAFALRADGWYLRQDIIWHKPNPMPESVRDRCTKAHEYIFLLTKSARYFYDAEAILEPVSPNTHKRLAQNIEAQVGSERAHAGGKTNGNMKAVGRKHGKVGREKNNASMDAALAVMPEARNKRSVWAVTTRGYPEAHFATFPPKLIEPCIKAGCPAGGIVLDPFGGSFTTAEVALKLDCDAVLCELNPEYIEMGKRRLKPLIGQSVLFT